MRLAIVTTRGHPTDPRTWSGIPASIVGELQGRPDVQLELIGPIAPKVVFGGRVLASVSRRVGRRVNFEVEPWVLGRMTRALRRELGRRQAVDAVLVLGWLPFAERIDAPVAYWGDATYGQRVDIAPHWSGLGRRTRRQVERHEARLLGSVDRVIMPGRWAALDAEVRCGVPAERISIVPFGAHLAGPLLDRTAPPGAEVRLLLVGVEWHRKGGDRAVLICDELRRRGVDASLDIVGIERHPPGWERPYVRYHGFLAQDGPGRDRLDALYRSAHVFLLPTRSDPFPIVLGEAAAYSLPAVATAVDGVPERLADGVTGVLVPTDATIERWADSVEWLVSDPESYVRIARRARERYETTANWSVATARLLEVLHDLVGSSRGAEAAPPS